MEYGITFYPLSNIGALKKCDEHVIARAHGLKLSY